MMTPAAIQPGHRRAPLVGLLAAGRVVIVLAATLALLAMASSVPRAADGLLTSLALFTSSAPNRANTLAVADWTSYFLHTKPTPPTGNTSPQIDNSMTTTAPTATRLYNYDTGCVAAGGRSLKVAAIGVNETRPCYYVNWLTPPFGAAETIDGTVRLLTWSNVRNFRQKSAGSLRAYLRTYDPATAAYTEITSTTLTDPNWQHGSTTWVRTMIVLAVSVTIPAGHQLELKVVTTGASSGTMFVAYDTTAYPSVLIVP